MAIMSSAEFVDALKVIEARLTLYNNSFPNNCCYFDGTYITSDCWNLGKSILWSQGACKNYNTSGQYAQPNTSICGDYDAVGLFNNYATYRSTDWNDLINNGVGGEWVRMNNEHMGFHVGGGVIVECTPIWENGVQYTYLRSDGSRISAPEYGSAYGGQWTEWCRMSQIEYGSQPQPQPTPTGLSVTYAAYDNANGVLPAVTNDSDYAGWTGDMGAFTAQFSDGGHSYMVHAIGSGWWGTITGYDPSFGNTNAYAGEKGAQLDFICITGAGYKYRVQVNHSYWLDWVYSRYANTNDYNTGCAGDGGVITGIQICPE